jgi:hypothetical protein
VFASAKLYAPLKSLLSPDAPAVVAPVRPKTLCDAPLGAIRVAVMSPTHEWKPVIDRATDDTAPDTPVTLKVTLSGVPWAVWQVVPEGRSGMFPVPVPANVAAGAAASGKRSAANP